MRKNISIAGLCFAWLCANGAIWDAVQVFAWGRMFTGYAQTQNLAEAFRATFDPEKPCPICVTVATAKDFEQKQARLPGESSSLEKLLLSFHTPAKLFFAPASIDWPAALASAGPSRTEPVPFPPPRV